MAQIDLLSHCLVSGYLKMEGVDRAAREVFESKCKVRAGIRGTVECRTTQERMHWYIYTK